MPASERDVLHQSDTLSLSLSLSLSVEIRHSRKTNSSFSHDSDISLSTHSADFSLTPPRSRKAVSFQGCVVLIKNKVQEQKPGVGWEVNPLDTLMGNGRKGRWFCIEETQAGQVEGRGVVGGRSHTLPNHRFGTSQPGIIQPTFTHPPTYNSLRPSPRPALPSPRQPFPCHSHPALGDRHMPL
ncbi:hypothetical protein E2C01_037747 [Portunus trituberculatus]|uniref:Uncharacterized protein n=1 Tax=Portunus trituberculatus TaxID=210409 RepID=A0A5B7FHT9_PORTR|nr:hypothetical protein [Portunus trituberculatus]